MPTKPRRVAWDACMWIAAIQRERIDLGGGMIEDRDAICRSIINEAGKGNIEIATSALALVEVCKIDPDEHADRDLVFEFYRHPWVLMVNVDTQVGQIGRALMGAGYPGLKPADATHIASALVADVFELQTFDGRLLALDGMIDKPTSGTLAIRKPKLQGQMGLFESGFEAKAGAQLKVSSPSSLTGREAGTALISDELLFRSIEPKRGRDDDPDPPVLGLPGPSDA